jgi:hypothetical protein
MRNVASIAELKESFFAEIDKVENPEDLEKLRVKYLGREKEILTAVLRSLGGIPVHEHFQLPRRTHHSNVGGGGTPWDNRP